jgi:uncharacterized membrane protein
MSGQTYVEFFQQLDKRIALPIPITGVGGTVAAGLAAVFSRHRRTFWLLLLACGLAVVGDLVTVLYNVPVNNRLATWNPTDLPPDYMGYLLQWWHWHQVRFVAMFAAMCLVFAAMLGDNKDTLADAAR